MNFVLIIWYVVALSAVLAHSTSAVPDDSDVPAASRRPCPRCDTTDYDLICGEANRSEGVIHKIFLNTCLMATENCGVLDADGMAVLFIFFIVLKRIKVFIIVLNFFPGNSNSVPRSRLWQMPWEWIRLGFFKFARRPACPLKTTTPVMQRTQTASI